MAGIPIYLHYCGGTLEKINYLVKGGNCCGGDEDDDSGCCRDENIVLMNATDFTVKTINNHEVVKTFCQLFYISLPCLNSFIPQNVSAPSFAAEYPPPKLQNSLLISTSVLRI